MCAAVRRVTVQSQAEGQLPDFANFLSLQGTRDAPFPSEKSRSQALNPVENFLDFGNQFLVLLSPGTG
jgi:hypothetical protein